MTRDTLNTEVALVSLTDAAKHFIKLEIYSSANKALTQALGPVFVLTFLNCLLQNTLCP